MLFQFATYSVRGCIPQSWAESNCALATIIAYHETALDGRENQENHTHHIYSRNVSCGNEYYAGDEDKHICYQFPASSHQHNLHYRSHSNLLQSPINQLKSIMVITVTYEDGLNNEIDRISAAHETVEEVRFYQGLCVCNRNKRNTVCCFPCGQQGEHDNNESIEPLRGDLGSKVIRYLSINDPWGSIIQFVSYDGGLRRSNYAPCRNNPDNMLKGPGPHAARRAYDWARGLKL